MKHDEPPKTKRSILRYIRGKPISYHPALLEAFVDWASGCGWQPQSLKRESERAIRRRHHEANIEHESHKARGNQPDIFTLSLGSVDVIYTVEPREVMIRGYGWEINRKPLDDFDGGGFYSDATCSLHSNAARDNLASVC